MKDKAKISALRLWRIRAVHVRENFVRDTPVSRDSFLAAKAGLRKGVDIRVLPPDNLCKIKLIENVVTATAGGLDCCVRPEIEFRGLVIGPEL